MEVLEVKVAEIKPLFRSDYTGSPSLEERMKKSGWLEIKPIPVIKTPDDLVSRWGEFTFVDGVRRFKAARAAGLETIRVLVYGQEDNIDEVVEMSGGNSSGKAWNYDSHLMYLRNPF